MQKCKRSTRLLVLFLAFALVLSMVPPMPLNAELAESYDYQYLYQVPPDEGNASEEYEYPACEAVPEDEGDEYPAYKAAPEYDTDADYENLPPYEYLAAEIAQLESEFSHLEFGVRPIVTPVAGHFPTSLYRWSIRPGGTDPAIDEHSFGYYLTLVWSPAVTSYFQPDTVYSVEIIMEPATSVWVPDWHTLYPGANMWQNVVGANVPASFYEIGATHYQVVGLPTEGVTSVSSHTVGDNLHVTVTFEPTGSIIEEARLVFFDDFSGSTNQFGLTTVWDRAPHNLFRQNMSIWRDEMSFIRDHQMVLAYQLATPTGGRTTIQEEFQHHMPSWWAQWPPFDAAHMPRAQYNFVEAGAVRTLTSNWLEATFEHAFGYYEARIRFPAQYQHNKRGTWGAFWLMNRNLTFEAALPAATGRSGAEIDIFESIGNHTGVFNAAVHWGGYVYGSSSRTFSQRVPSADPNWVNVYDGNYHIFSVEWSPTDYRFFINGVEFGSLSRAQSGLGLSPWTTAAQHTNALTHQVNQNPNYIKLSAETALWALNEVGANFNFPRDLYGEMIIDYVAVWNGPRPNVSIDELANYTELDATLAVANALSSYNYTSATWAILIAAVNAANALPRNLSVVLQYRVDAAAAVITNAINNLVTESAALDYADARVEYYIDDTLDLSGLYIVITYGDGTDRRVPVTIDMVSGFNSSVPNENLVLTIIYGQHSLTFTISVIERAAEIESVTLDYVEARTIYYVGDALDLTGLYVVVTYDNGTYRRVPVTAAMVSGFDSSVPNANLMLIINYGDFELTFTIAVSAVIAGPPPPQLPPDPPLPLPPTPEVSEPTSSSPFLPLVRWQPSQEPPGQAYEYVAYVEYGEADDAQDESTDAPPLLVLPPPPASMNKLIFTVGRIEYLLNAQSRIGVGAPFIDPTSDRMMVPLRTLVEATGANVEWDSNARSAMLHLPTGTLTLPVNAPLPDGMGMPMLVNDRAFVPLRFILYALNKTVEWDSANRAAVITW